MIFYCDVLWIIEWAKLFLYWNFFFLLLRIWLFSVAPVLALNNTWTLSKPLIISIVKVKSLSHVRLFVIPWTIQSVEFSRLAAQLVKNLPQCRRPQFDSWIGKISWRREWLPTPAFWPGEFHRMYSPWDCKELDMTEWLSLSHGLGEGQNGEWVLNGTKFLVEVMKTL